MKKYLYLILLSFLFAGCSSGNMFFIEYNNGSFWYEDNMTSSEFNNDNSTGNFSVLRYNVSNVFIDKNLSVNDLIIRSPSSLYIGGKNFSRISATVQFFPIVNRSRKFVNIDQSTLVFNSYDGTQFMSNVNLHTGENSSAIVSSSDFGGDGFVLQKYNMNHEKPYLNVLAGLRGNVEIMSTFDNSLNLSDTGNNRISLGFYQNLSLGGEASLLSYNNREFIIELNQTEINLNKKTDVEENLYFKHLNISERPTNKGGYVGMYCAENVKCYIMRSDGSERRIVDAAGGSYHFDEATYFNTSSIYLEHTDYSGSGNRFVCIDTNEKIFVSSTACN